MDPRLLTLKTRFGGTRKLEQKGTMLHLHPPFPLLYPSPTLEKAILSTWRATDPVVVIIILSYILREICIRGLKPGFDKSSDELNLLQRSTGLKRTRDKVVGIAKHNKRKRLEIDANQGLPIFLSLSV